MYTHYYVTSYGINNPFKKYITKLQILQFYSCILHSFIVVLYENIVPKKLALFELSYHISMILLFSNFYNKTYNRKDVYFMGFHPETPADPDSEAFLCDPTDNPVEHSDLEYSMMLIQKFKQLYEASCKLHKIGYYEKWPKEYYEEVVSERQRTYEQLFKKGVKS